MLEEGVNHFEKKRWENSIKMFLNADIAENNIKKYLQTKDASFLKKVKADNMKNYLKKFAKKTVKGTKPKLMKQLQEWRKQIKKENIT